MAAAMGRSDGLWKTQGRSSSSLAFSRSSSALRPALVPWAATTGGLDERGKDTKEVKAVKELDAQIVKELQQTGEAYNQQQGMKLSVATAAAPHLSQLTSEPVDPVKVKGLSYLESLS
jgi:hypothetical protein